jgi:ubiquinone/menaquinone biosynthesis C-methylase UbiE
MTSNLDCDHYFSTSYDTKERFISYWHQINEITKLKVSNCLEVGVGNGFVSRYLITRGVNVITLDVNPNLDSNIIGTVLSIPFVHRSFDIVSCCEVLEHLPYHYFPQALKELHRVSRRYVILSLPDHTPVYRFNVELPRVKPIKKLIPHPFPRTSHHEFDGVHHWIIGKKNYSLKKIETDLKRLGYKIKNTYRVWEFYGHRFFLLEKI